VTVSTPALVDAQKASDAMQAWAAADPDLARLLASGMTMVQAAARWGLQLLKANRIADAATVFRAAVALRPDDPSPWLNLGIALDRSGAPAEAADCLDRALALSRNQPDTWTLLGVVRGRLGDRRGAEAAYRVALELQPTSVAAWQCLAILK
jgi:Flp pilus assembly protein TadD